MCSFGDDDMDFGDDDDGVSFSTKSAVLMVAFQRLAPQTSREIARIDQIFEFSSPRTQVHDFIR